eukprot:1719678-Rhodomonas_salina.1
MLYPKSMWKSSVALDGACNDGGTPWIRIRWFCRWLSGDSLELVLEPLCCTQLSLGQLALVLDAVLASSFAHAADGAHPVVHERREIQGKALSVIQLEVLQVLGPARVAPL